jgi:hypothetical protein
LVEHKAHGSVEMLRRHVFHVLGFCFGVGDDTRPRHLGSVLAFGGDLLGLLAHVGQRLIAHGGGRVFSFCSHLLGLPLSVVVDLDGLLFDGQYLGNCFLTHLDLSKNKSRVQRRRATRTVLGGAEDSSTRPGFVKMVAGFSLPPRRKGRKDCYFLWVLCSENRMAALLG